jgi:addiction module HigA family antidote
MRSEIVDCSRCVNHVMLACRANPLRLANLRHLRLEGISSGYRTPSEKWSQGLVSSGSSIRLPSLVPRPTGFRALQTSRRVPAAFSIHPGAILLTEFMEPLGRTAYRLAKDLHISIPRVNDLVRDERGIIVDTALRLRRYFGNSALVLDRVAERLSLVGRVRKQVLEQG